MNLRRQETNLQTAQPVRFYKFIALTFLFLTIILLGVIIFMSSKRAKITIMTRPEPVDINVTVKVGQGEESGLIAGAVTTTLVVWEEDFYPTGSKEEPGIATGIVTLHNETGISQPLVATTRLLTAEGVLFRLKDGVTIPANGTITAQVYSDKEGKENNIKSSKFTIPGLNESKQKVVYATSEEAMKGGVRQIGVLSSNDVKKAEQVILEKATQQGKEILSKIYPNKIGIFSLTEGTTETEAEIGKEIDGFTLKATATILGVFYNKAQVNEKAEKELLKRIVSDSEIVSPSKEDPVATLDSYDLNKGQASLNVFYSGLAVLDPESKQIEKTVFYGKTKDEVRRYLLSLDHVSGVEVDFSPAWMHTVPHVSEHVDVVVKQVD